MTERYELSKPDFKVLDFALLLFVNDAQPNPVDKDRARDLREKLQTAYTAWIEEDK